ncbi:hypothetical protein SV7mr_50610 [Stieleria bergensis]|uniref:Uncharacterized protein n=1 Tax=Stieleria bergensis TaxID=2528025 RepID=A0A517T2A3_9BACT|nr:hypothetical protein SV7mr_50610 [Planctomycetes bacterium SV_7m_r]
MKFILQPWQLIAILLAGWVNRQQQEAIDYLRTENDLPIHNSIVTESLFRGNEQSVGRTRLTGQTNSSVASFGPNSWAFRSCLG